MRSGLVVGTAVLLAFAGCLESARRASLEEGAVAIADLAVVLPQTDFYVEKSRTYHYLPAEPGAPFHSLDEVYARVVEFQERRPDLVTIEEIGRTLQDRPLYDIVVTNGTIAGPKVAPFFDGGHHANEVAGTELILYTVDFLLDNYDSNRTVRRWVDEYEIHLVPLVNPDGYVVHTRGNALGVNLNRNYDVDWGNPGGASNLVMGTAAHETGRAMPSVPVVAENSGPYAFSEPEARAIRDRLAMIEGNGSRLAFYMTYHTPTNGFIAPWAAFDPPFALPPEHDEVLGGVLDWVNENTEYKAGKAQWGDFSAGLPYAASGSSMDWAYMRHQVPAFTLEIEIWFTSIVSENYAQRNLAPYNGLEYWMKASLPIPLVLLANAEKLASWEMPTTEPPLPEGVPAYRPAELDLCVPLVSDEHPLRGALPWATCEIL